MVHHILIMLFLGSIKKLLFVGHKSLRYLTLDVGMAHCWQGQETPKETIH